MAELYAEYLEWKSKDSTRVTWSFYEWLRVFN